MNISGVAEKMKNKGLRDLEKGVGYLDVTSSGYLRRNLIIFTTRTVEPG